MTLIRFPDPRYAGDEGIVAIGGTLNAANLLSAYSRGIFPWPIEGWPLTWFCPGERAIIEFDDLHVPRSLAREQRRAPFTFTTNQDFNAVITSCAKAARPEEEGTWITPQMIRAYNELHRIGTRTASSVGRGALVGGIYGVDAGARSPARACSTRAPRRRNSRCFI